MKTNKLMMKFLLQLVAILAPVTVFSQQQLLLGTASAGAEGVGSIYVIPTGSNSVIQKNDFGYVDGGYPRYSEITEMANGLFYGMTYSGGSANLGVIFEYNPFTNKCIKKAEFNGTNGGKPYGSLCLANNGKLYGMTWNGGVNSVGTLFEFNPATGVLTKKFDFDGTVNGSYPYGSLIKDSNDILWGTTSNGGSGSNGVIFSYDPVLNQFTKQANLSTTTGYGSFGDLLIAPNGKMYGMTEKGGSSDMGILYEFNPATNGVIKKLDFSGTANGANPRGTLALKGTKLYGTTAQGGTNNRGIFFDYDYSTNTLTKQHDFFSTTNDGSYPYTKPVLYSNGLFYGMTYTGGNYGYGTVYSFDPVGSTYTKLYDFGDILFPGTKPIGNFLLTSQGQLLAMTSAGGQNNWGVFFEFDQANNSCLKKFEFASYVNGTYPYACLTKASSGKIYGLTSSGGTSNSGVFFEYDPSTNSSIKIIDFTGGTNGYLPKGAITEASNGKFYGLMSAGGTSSVGVLYEYSLATLTYLKKVDFNGTNGATPIGSLFQASNGKLYGLTSIGGTNNMGTLFEYDINSATLTKKVDFDGTNLGSLPYGSLIEATSGKLMGMTTTGGVNDLGVLFEYDITSGVISKKVDFTGTSNGSNPYGSLFKANNGKLYGLTNKGGTYNLGTLFEYDLTLGSLIKKVDFAGISNGRFPLGSLMQASDGKLYGTTSYGGTGNYGTVFDYDISTGVLSKKTDLTAQTGTYPQYGQLLEVFTVPAGIQERQDETLKTLIVYPNPTESDVTVRFNDQASVVELYNILGEKCLSIHPLGHQRDININVSCKPGVYFVIVKFTNGKSLVSRLIKQ